MRILQRRKMPEAPVGPKSAVPAQRGRRSRRGQVRAARTRSTGAEEERRPREEFRPGREPEQLTGRTHSVVPPVSRPAARSLEWCPAPRVVVPH